VLRYCIYQYDVMGIGSGYTPREDAHEKMKLADTLLNTRCKKNQFPTLFLETVCRIVSVTLGPAAYVRPAPEHYDEEGSLP